MRSMKLTVAMAVLAVLVAGPVMAQSEAPSTDSPAATSTDSTKATKATKKKHHGHKHHKKSTSNGAMESTTTK